MGRRKFFIFHCFIAVLFCGILQGNAAQPRATEILERLAAGFRAMDGYGVKFGVVSGDYEARGSYVVEGDSYYLVLGDAEVFADGAVRREVDNRRREVTVTEVDTASRNILNNPVRAFDFLGSEYTPSLVSEADGRTGVRLTPSRSAVSVRLSSSPLLYSPEKSAFRRMAVICTRTGMAFFKLSIVWCASIGSEIPAFPDGKTGILLFFYLRISFPKYRVKHFRNEISYTIFVVLHKKDV